MTRASAPVTVLVPDPLLGLVAAEVTMPVAEAAADVTGVGAPVRVPDPVLGPVAGHRRRRARDRRRTRLGPVAAEVTVPVAEAAADVTGVGAPVRVPDPVLGPVAEVLVPDPVLGLVAAEVTVPVAEAAAEVTVRWRERPPT